MMDRGLFVCKTDVQCNEPPFPAPSGDPNLMFGRALGIPLLLAAAVGVPYVATNGSSGTGFWKKGFWNSSTEPVSSQRAVGAESLAGASSSELPSMQGPGAVLYPETTPLEGAPSMSLHDVFRFNVSREWVYQHWARKSTALAELGSYGIRVPLVTGTQLFDLAGSLTYFFGEDGRVERISFRGRTGDTTQIVMLMIQRYGMVQQATPVVGEQLFQFRRNEQVISELRTRPAHVLWTSAPHDSFAVELELQRPDATTPLPPRDLPLSTVADAASLPENAAAASTKTAEQEAEDGWNLFPRSRIPQGQVKNLDRRDLSW